MLFPHGEIYHSTLKWTELSCDHNKVKMERQMTQVEVNFWHNVAKTVKVNTLNQTLPQVQISTDSAPSLKLHWNQEFKVPTYYCQNIHAGWMSCSVSRPICLPYKVTNLRKNTSLDRMRCDTHIFHCESSGSVTCVSTVKQHEKLKEGCKDCEPAALNIQHTCFSPFKTEATALMEGKRLQRN